MNEVKQTEVLKAINTELFKRNVLYHKVIAKATGSPGLAILWSQIYYWQDRCHDEDKWVYKTAEDLFDETGLTRRMQETARKVGKHYGVLEEKRAGVPGKIHFRVNLDKAVEVIGNYLQQAGEVENQEGPFNLRDEITKLEDNPRRDMNVIALYMDMKYDNLKETISNKKTLQVAIRRHLRPAKDLVDFTDAQIVKGADKAKAQTREWTLETVVKHLTK